jgi:hypothetical protein
MKTGLTIYSKALRLSSIIILTTIFFSATAQSARVAQTPEPTQSLTPQAASAEGSEAKSDFVVDASADRYKLVSPTGYEGAAVFRLEKQKDREALERVDFSEFENFQEQLNKAGAQGYRLVSAVYTGHPIALMELDRVQYEYEWFQTRNSNYAPLGGDEDKYAELAKRGFRLADHFIVFSYCEDNDKENSAYGQWCEQRHLFLLMREKGVEKPVQYALVTPLVVKHVDKRVEFTNRLRERLAEGFNSVNVLGEDEILLERTGKRDARLNEKSDVQIVLGRTWWDGTRLSDRVREWGKQGYRLALINDRIALMYRDGASAQPFKYVWLDSTSAKNWHLETRLAPTFEKYLAKLQESGAVYVTTNNQEWEDELIFEQRAGGASKPSEYKVLTLALQIDVNPFDKKASVDLTASTKETMKQINNLVKEGFVVRDLFLSNNLSVILERKR